MSRTETRGGKERFFSGLATFSFPVGPEGDLFFKGAQHLHSCKNHLYKWALLETYILCLVTEKYTVQTGLLILVTT